MPVTGKLACEISTAGLGVLVMAIGSGVTGGTLTAPAMLAGGAFGYLIGKAVCKIPVVQKAFDRALGLDDWSALEAALADPSVRRQGVALVEEETGVNSSRAEQIWDALILAVKLHPGAIVQSRSFNAAAYHPATGRMKHGIAVLKLTSSAQA